MQVAQDGDGSDQQGVVGKRGKKLRRHDDVEAKAHGPGFYTTKGIRFPCRGGLGEKSGHQAILCR